MTAPNRRRKRQEDVNRGSCRIRWRDSADTGPKCLDNMLSLCMRYAGNGDVKCGADMSLSLSKRTLWALCKMDAWDSSKAMREESSQSASLDLHACLQREAKAEREQRS